MDQEMVGKKSPHPSILNDSINLANESMNLGGDHFFNDNQRSHRNSILMEDNAQSDLFKSHRNSGIFDSRRNSVNQFTLNSSHCDNESNHHFYKKPDLFADEALFSPANNDILLNLESDTKQKPFELDRAGNANVLLLDSDLKSGKIEALEGKPVPSAAQFAKSVKEEELKNERN